MTSIPFWNRAFSSMSPEQRNVIRLAYRRMREGGASIDFTRVSFYIILAVDSDKVYNYEEKA